LYWAKEGGKIERRELREKSKGRKLAVKNEGRKVKKREHTTFLFITTVLMHIHVFFKATKYSRKTCSTDKPFPFNRRVPGSVASQFVWKL
jgi:hypothetical protein